MTATYPTDVIFDVNTFSVIGSVTYTNTGTRTDFNLPGRVAHRGEVLAFLEGILQSTDTYSLINSNFTTSFFAAPTAANLTLKTVSIPFNLTKIVDTHITMSSVYYSNADPVTINSNTYVTNGTRTVWSLPNANTALSKNDLLVAISGVLQHDGAYIFPSVTLGGNGIDISPALTSNDTLQIRLFFNGDISHVNDRCRDLSNRKPDKGFQLDRTVRVEKFESQIGYESRRLISRRPERVWQLSYTNVSGTEKSALETFYNERYGEWEKFFFDLTHVNELQGTAIVRFEGSLKIKHNLSRGTGLNDNFYTIDLVLKETI